MLGGQRPHVLDDLGLRGEWVRTVHRRQVLQARRPVELEAPLSLVKRRAVHAQALPRQLLCRILRPDALQCAHHVLTLRALSLQGHEMSGKIPNSTVGRAGAGSEVQTNRANLPRHLVTLVDRQSEFPAL